MSQTQLFPGGDAQDDNEDNIGAQVQANAMESILDEIDAVLEENAESFVEGFVQKGGQ